MYLCLLWVVCVITVLVHVTLKTTLSTKSKIHQRSSHAHHLPVPYLGYLCMCLAIVYPINITPSINWCGFDPYRCIVHFHCRMTHPCVRGRQNGKLINGSTSQVLGKPPYVVAIQQQIFPRPQNRCPDIKIGIFTYMVKTWIKVFSSHEYFQFSFLLPHRKNCMSLPL